VATRSFIQCTMFRAVLLLLVALQVSLLVSAESSLLEASGLQAGAAGNATLGSCSYQATCTVSGIEGVCVSISAGCCSGTATANLCPGSSDIKCCTKNKCSTPKGSGTCMQTSKCSGTSVAGYCVGPSDLQCCVGSSPTPSSSSYGIDVSQSMSSSTASCLAGTYSFIIPRGFKSTGAVDTAVCTTLNSAKSAGFKTRDVYLFPCMCFSTIFNPALISLDS
jgi:hypothetical protein